MSDVELLVAEEWVEAAAELLVQAARAGGHVALAGGSTPRPVYERAAALEPAWDAVEIWWGDERCVPPDDERSNYRLAREALLDRVSTGPVHRIRGELGPDEAADGYERELRGTHLDLVVLGIGADGHTASLFPGSAALDERERQVLAAEGPDVPRVTLTFPAIRAAGTVLFVVAGEEKAEAAERAFGQPSSPATPASLARGRTRTVAVLDPAAASRLQS